jgi:hypothetical protein
MRLLDQQPYGQQSHQSQQQLGQNAVQVSKLFSQAMGWDDALPAAVAALQLLAFGRWWANRQASRSGGSQANMMALTDNRTLDANSPSSAAVASFSSSSALPAVISTPGTSASAASTSSSSSSSSSSSASSAEPDAAAVASVANFAPPSAADVRLIQSVEAATQQLYALMETALKSTDPAASGMALKHNFEGHIVCIFALYLEISARIWVFCTSNFLFFTRPHAHSMFLHHPRQI